MGKGSKSAAPEEKVELQPLTLEIPLCWSFVLPGKIHTYLGQTNQKKIKERINNENLMKYMHYQDDKKKNYGTMELAVGQQKFHVTAGIFWEEEKGVKSFILYAPSKCNKDTFKKLKDALTDGSSGRGRCAEETKAGQQMYCKEKLPPKTSKTDHGCFFLRDIRLSDFTRLESKLWIVKTIEATVSNEVPNETSSGSETPVAESGGARVASPGADPPVSAESTPAPAAASRKRWRQELGSTSKPVDDVDQQLLAKLLPETGDDAWEMFRDIALKCKEGEPDPPAPPLTKLNVEWLPSATESVEATLLSGACPPSIRTVFRAIPERLGDQEALMANISLDTLWLSKIPKSK